MPGRPVLRMLLDEVGCVSGGKKNCPELGAREAGREGERQGAGYIIKM